MVIVLRSYAAATEHPMASGKSLLVLQPRRGPRAGYGSRVRCVTSSIFSSRARAKMSAVQKLSRFQVRLLQHARRRRRLGSLACPRVPVPSSYRSLSGALGNQAPASGAKTWNESRWVCQRIDIHVIMTRNMVRVAVPQ